MGPGGSDTIPGNSQLGLLVLPIPRMWLEVLEAWYFHQTVWRRSLGPSFTPGSMEVVLEAQFYTRQMGRIWSTMITAARGDES